MVVKGTIKAVKPYGLLMQIQQVCEHIDGSLSHFTADFVRIHELDIRVALLLFKRQCDIIDDMLIPCLLHCRPCATLLTSQKNILLISLWKCPMLTM